MHDIDRAMFELNEHSGETFQESYESFEGPYEQEGQYEQEGPFETFESYEATHEAETQELEFATRLMEVSNEAELEQFLGSLVRSATSAVRGFANSATGQALGGVLKNAARQVLPQVGGIAGSALGGSAGGQLGSAAGKWLGGRFELEGLSAEDREFEVARAFVRTAQDAARTAMRSPQAPPVKVATTAVANAASRHLPGLVPALTTGTRRTQGRWVRRGNRIVLFGV